MKHIILNFCSNIPNVSLVLLLAEPRRMLVVVCNLDDKLLRDPLILYRGNHEQAVLSASTALNESWQIIINYNYLSIAISCISIRGHLMMIKANSSISILFR